MKCRLKELRIARGLTQSGLAMELHVSQQTISRIEKGGAYMPVDVAKKAADYFQVSVAYILGLTDERRVTATVEKSKYLFGEHGDFAAAYMELDGEHRAHVAELIHRLWSMQSAFEAADQSERVPDVCEQEGQND